MTTAISTALDDWADAVTDLSRAEQALLGWQLRGAPPPASAVEKAHALQCRVSFLFERAQLILAERDLLSVTTVL